MSEATQNRAPAADTGTPVEKSRPPRQPARPLVMLLEIVWLLALGAAVCWKFVPGDSRGCWWDSYISRPPRAIGATRPSTRPSKRPPKR